MKHGVACVPIFDTDLFTDGKGPNLGNAQDVRLVYSLADPYPSHSLAGRRNYANPPYTNKELYSFFHKANQDFNLDPENTSFLIVVPKWENADWWFFTYSYTIVEEFPIGSKIFTCPAEQTFDTHKLVPAEEEGGDGRVYIAGTPWPVVVLHRDCNTPVRINDVVKLHLRLGHLGAKTLVHLIDADIDTGLQVHRDQLLHTDPLCRCTACKLAKATRPGPHRAREAAPPDDDIVPFSSWTADLCGPICPEGYNGSRYFNVMCCYDTNYTILVDISAKSCTLDSLQEGMDHITSRGIRDGMQGSLLHTDNGTESLQITPLVIRGYKRVIYNYTVL